MRAPRFQAVILLAVLLSHDAIPRERGRGTLRLILSNPISRRTILSVKFAGLILIMSGILAYTLMLYTLVVVLFGKVAGAPGPKLIEMFIIAMVSLPVLIVFISIGLASSTVVRSSSLALSISMSVWALAVLVWPSLAPYVASSLSATPSLQLTQRESFYKEAELIRSELSEHRNIVAQLKAENAGVDQAWQRYQKINGSWIERKLEEIGRLNDERKLDLRRQQGATKLMLLASPYGAFNYALETTCDTGLDSANAFYDLAERYCHEEFLPASLELLSRQEPWKGSSGQGGHLQLQAFQAQPLTMTERMRRLRLPLTILGLEIAVIFLFSFLRFERYDVR